MYFLYFSLQNKMKRNQTYLQNIYFKWLSQMFKVTSLLLPLDLRPNTRTEQIMQHHKHVIRVYTSNTRCA